MSVYTSTVNTARNVRDTAISKANTAEKNAKLQYKQALNSGDQEAINIAEKTIRDAKAAKEQARTEYKITKDKAKSDAKIVKEQARTENKILKEQRKAANEQAKADSGSGDNTMSKNKKGLGLQFSQSFYDNIGNAVKGQPTGNLADVKSKGADAQSQNLRNAAATNQMEAQRAQQIANQNPYAEAGKMASVQNDAENRQNVQKAGVLGAGAALARKTNTPNIQSEKQREDQQQNVANQRREEEQANQQEATEKGNESEQWQFKSRDYTEDKDQAAALSKGEPVQPEQKPEEPVQPEQKPEEPVQPEQKPEEPVQPEQKPEEPSMPSGEPQHVINALLGSSKGEDLRSGKADAADKELYDWAISQGVKPIQAGQHKNENDVNSWEQEFIANNGEAGQNVMQQLRQGRAGAGNDASRNFGANEMGQMNKSMTVTNNPPSDARVKDIKQCLCDARMKWIKEDWDRDGKPSREDMIWLIKQNGLFHHNDRDYDPDDYDNWGDEDGSILGAYADNIKNYVYNYKPEATQVDPNIDPNQEHIGPMAQDIEQVNPACVKETPEGVKTVDTSRLAMMNAGAIGDLAREIQDLKVRLAKLGV
ncbi:MAG: hypothetical protein UIM53_04505 [Acutalibacteraceae bacterium]|nr:hypothetical protein [Acutalibacteraceae bacterium]